MRRHGVRVLLATALLIAAGVSGAEVPRQEQQPLQGTWRAVAVEQAGDKRPEQEIRNWTLQVAGDRMTARDGDKVLDESTYTLDPARDPKAITIAYTDGPDKGKRLRGIYRLEGDTLTICTSAGDREPPNAFTTRAGSDWTLFVLKRQKP